MKYSNMDHIKRLYPVLLLIVVWLYISCNPSPWYKNKFYNYTTLSDYKRIPLIPNFELLNDGSGWEIMIGHRDLAATYIDQIYIKKNEFILGSGNRGKMQFGSDTMPRMVYFIIDFNKKVIDAFCKAEKFDSMLVSKGVNKKDLIPVKQVDQIYSTFAKTGVLPWYNE